MKNLLSYLNGLPTQEQQDFAGRAGTTVGYLRKAISTGQRIGEGLVIKLERESGGTVRCEDMRPDVDWAYLIARQHDPAPQDPQPTDTSPTTEPQGVANV